MGFLLAFFLAEVGIFVALSYHFGFLWTLVFYILFSLVCRLALDAYIKRNAEKSQETLDKLQSSGTPESEAELRKLMQQLITVQSFSMFLKLLFSIPGLICKIVGFVYWWNLIRLQHSNTPITGDQFSGFMQSFFRRTNTSKYEDELYARYGRSERDVQREQEEAELRAEKKRRQRGEPPRPNYRAGSATVEEMKAKFQENKEVKEAKFEEIVEPQEQDKDTKS